MAMRQCWTNLGAALHPLRGLGNEVVASPLIGVDSDVTLRPMGDIGGLEILVVFILLAAIGIVVTLAVRAGARRR